MFVHPCGALEVVGSMFFIDLWRERELQRIVTNSLHNPFLSQSMFSIDLLSKYTLRTQITTKKSSFFRVEKNKIFFLYVGRVS